ncbi:VOC family protein [Crenobacter cavernae]|uniref:VOC family protein n=1 Tax=Crenobacter cavernae TaxID=2290923 RepID=A0A345Y2K4_9NEIS|nr:VOC family protein [Crenobacter cavernae]AXK38156.1 VOC family protein [Crenobacter cavernae]
MAVKPVPDGYHTVTPYLAILNAAAAIDFYKQAFGAVEAMRVDAPGGKVGHAELRIGDSAVMLADECPDMGFRSPQTLGGPGMTLMLYVDDVDAWFARALDAGAKTLRPLQDQFYGDRSGTLEDPFGHVWTLATHIEDLSFEEITERAAKFMVKS